MKVFQLKSFIEFLKEIILYIVFSLLLASQFPSGRLVLCWFNVYD